MRNSKTKIILEDMQQSMKYKFLEIASVKKDKSEMEAIARKRGLVVPSPEIALFKGLYTRADKCNLNGSCLSSKEIARALDTLILKPVTLNHDEHEIIGVVLDAKFEDNKDVIIVGAIYKDNYNKEFSKLKSGFETGEIGLSYELYGNKIMRADGKKYDWSDVSFCGAGILDKDVKPAMPGSKVYEFAKIKEVAVNEIILTTCEKCGFKFDTSTVKPEDNGGIKCPHCKEVIGLNVQSAETNMIPCNCPVCGMRTWKDVVDNKSNEITAICVGCGKSFLFEIEEIKNKIQKLGISAVFSGSTSCHQCGNTIKFPVWSDLKKTPLICDKCGLSFIHTKKENTNKFIIKSIMEVNTMNELQKAFAKVEKAEDITEDMVSLYEESSEEIQNTLDEKVKELAKVKVDQKKTVTDSQAIKDSKEKAYEDAVKEIAANMGIEVEKVKDLLNKKEVASERVDVLTNGIKKLALEVMNMREDAKMFGEYEKELASSKEMANKELAMAIENKDKEIANVKESYRVEAKTIYDRKQELGEFSKEMTDEDLLNDKDYEIAKLKKELASKKVKDTAVVDPQINPEVGSGDVKPTEKETAQDKYNVKMHEATKKLQEKRDRTNKLYNK